MTTSDASLQDTVEGLVDQHGARALLAAFVEVAYLKSIHYRMSDEATAERWERVARSLRDSNAGASNLAAQLERLGEVLASKGRPGHCDHISKADASAWVYRLAKELRARDSRLTF